MYEIKAEDTFIQDVNRWSKKIPNLWDEIQAITSYMQETGEIPEEYDPHLLTNEELNYVGYFEFHLFEGKTNDIAGDGTTTATVLTQAIVNAGMKNVTSGANPVGIRRGIDKATEAAVEALKKMSHDVKTKDDIAQIASISAANPEVGKLIADAMEKVGHDGVITIEDSRGVETSVDVVEGMSFDRGYMSQYMVTDNDKMEADLDNPYILITDKKISNIQDILPLLQSVV